MCSSDLVVIYDLNESGDLGAIAVLGTAMLLITFAVVGFANWISGVGSGVGPEGSRSRGWEFSGPSA